MQSSIRGFRKTPTMVKSFRQGVRSWLSNSQTAASTNGDSDKKSNRMSLSSFTQLRHKDEEYTQKKDEEPGVPQTQNQTSRMAALAETIRIETEKLEKYMQVNGLGEPGFAIDAPKDFPPLPHDMQESRQRIVHATEELSSLVRGPRENVRWTVWNYLDTLSLQIVNNYGLAKLVPLDGSAIALTKLQTMTPLDPVNLARVLRHAMTNHIFCEPSPGFIAHTAASRLLVEDAVLQDWVGFNSEETFPAAGHVLQALKKYPDANIPNRTGFNFAFDTVDADPMFVTFGKDPSRAKRMGGAMASLTGGEGYEVSYFVDDCDLHEVNDRGGTLVDIGGSHGFVSVDLAKKWKKMKFVVQDLPRTVESAPKPICEDETVAERIELQAHDFFTEQPVKGADVYFFRWIIHNYSTPYAIAILKNLVPALKPGARIIINDICLREPGSESPWDEKMIRGMDLVMMTLLNAQERDEGEFRELFKAADPRFEFKGVKRAPHCRMSVVEAVWNPENIEPNGVEGEPA